MIRVSAFSACFRAIVLRAISYWKVGMGSLTCATIVTRAVHKKEKQVWTSLHKCPLGREKDSLKRGEPKRGNLSLQVHLPMQPRRLTARPKPTHPSVLVITVPVEVRPHASPRLLLYLSTVAGTRKCSRLSAAWRRTVSNRCSDGRTYTHASLWLIHYLPSLQEHGEGEEQSVTAAPMDVHIPMQVCDWFIICHRCRNTAKAKNSQ